ncbi:DUF2938 domain-containing protein [Klebsiella aerogenes]|uniref:DUF2938 domain-containing protein n=1 Tax=Klebsiella aerogenes TaxID=548 RepID=UPI003752D6BF|nr:DUF2938 domain-containing protein [Klebsiella aerogenes]
MNIMVVVQILVTGLGATLVMDLWSLFQKHILKIAPLNYALVGRWALWLWRGKVRHKTICATPLLHGERFIGWLCHYLIGIAFAAVPLALSGADWFYAPTLATALLSGVVTLLAPFLILQPAFGFGVAASRTPRPWLARSLSLLAHLAYGIGLYLAASAYKVMAMSADL